MLAELRVTELELQAEVARRDIAVGLHPEWVKTRAAIELHRKRYEAYVKALAEMFWRNHG